jgi:hypothetical protein
VTPVRWDDTVKVGAWLIFHSPNRFAMFDRDFIANESFGGSMLVHRYVLDFGALARDGFVQHYIHLCIPITGLMLQVAA